MNTYDMSVMEEAMAQQFAEALAAISDTRQMQLFLRDVMTEKEIIETSARFEAAKMLADGASYSDIISRTKLSSRTVARISDWLQNGTGGYSAVIAGSHRSHISPEVVG
jgi:TrpR-related protein YerC/YecD